MRYLYENGKWFKTKGYTIHDPDTGTISPVVEPCDPPPEFAASFSVGVPEDVVRRIVRMAAFVAEDESPNHMLGIFKDIEHYGEGALAALNDTAKESGENRVCFECGNVYTLHDHEDVKEEVESIEPTHAEKIIEHLEEFANDPSTAKRLPTPYEIGKAKAKAVADALPLLRGAVVQWWKAGQQWLVRYNTNSDVTVSLSEHPLKGRCTKPTLAEEAEHDCSYTVGEDA